MAGKRHESCCFTGHRPEKLPWRYEEDDPRALALKERIFDVVEALYQAGMRHYICGMARGCDFYFCEAVLRLREEHGEITLEAAIPFEGQASDWPERERNRYFHLVSQCDVETVLTTAYEKECMKNRNHYMVDHATVLIAVYDGFFGGTMQTVNYAKKQGLEVIEIRP